MSRSLVRRTRPGSRLVALALDTPAQPDPDLEQADQMEPDMQLNKSLSGPAGQRLTLDLIEELEVAERETTDDDLHESAPQSAPQDSGELPLPEMMMKMACVMHVTSHLLN